MRFGAYLDPAVAGELRVERRVAGVDAEPRRVEREELVHAGHDLDVADADPADDRGAQLLVAAAEQSALTADDADDQRRRLVSEQLEQLALAEV